MKIYKYMTDKTFHTYLNSHMAGEVYLSPWRMLNDPMEGYFSFIAHSDSRYIVDAIVSEKSAYRVCCFSKSYRKYLLWSYYTNKHRGVCLEFTVKRDHLPTDCILEPITYSRTLPQLDPDESVDEQAKRFLLTKIVPWRHEREVRLLCRNRQNPTIPLGRLTGIIFGVNYAAGDAQDHTRQRVVEMARNHGRTAPALYQAVIEGGAPEIHRQIFERYDQNRS